jgi:hypothetical protein
MAGNTPSVEYFEYIVHEEIYVDVLGVVRC